MRIVLVTVLVGAILAGCTSKLESDFIAGCKSTGGSSAYCSCTYKKLEPALKAAEKNQSLMFTSEFKRAYDAAIQVCCERPVRPS